MGKKLAAWRPAVECCPDIASESLIPGVRREEGSEHATRVRNKGADEEDEGRSVDGVSNPIRVQGTSGRGSVSAQCFRDEGGRLLR